jgi:starch-binding outer membrane protein, SusD/RagB family
MHRAQRSAEATAGRYKAIAPGDPGYPEMLTVAGYTYIFFAETFCSGTPVSRIDSTGKITYGQPLTTTQLLDTAIARFDSAIHIATVRDTAPVVDPSVQQSLITFAQVGKARALLFQGSAQYAAAAAVAATVPTSFAYVLEHTTTTDRENNGVFNAGATDGRYSLADSEGVHGFPFLSVSDARTPFQLDPGQVGFDLSTLLWDNLRYGGRASPITVATGVEARLIEAEAALSAGQAATFFAKLNDPR